jgi:hypothetical protein
MQLLNLALIDLPVDPQLQLQLLLEELLQQVKLYLGLLFLCCTFRERQFEYWPFILLDMRVSLIEECFIIHLQIVNLIVSRSLQEVPRSLSVVSALKEFGFLFL